MNPEPKEALPEVETQGVEEGGQKAQTKKIAVIGPEPLDMSKIPTDGEVVGATPKVEIIVPPEELDEEGFPIIPEEAFGYFEQIGMPADMIHQVIDTAKETMRNLKLQKEQGEEWTKETQDLYDGAMDALKTYWDAYKKMPSREEMMNAVSDYFDSKFFEEFSVTKGLRPFGTLVGGLTNAAISTRSKWGAGLPEEQVFHMFTPDRYMRHLKSFSYFIRKMVQVPGIDGNHAKKVIDHSYFIPAILISALSKFDSQGPDSVAIPGVRAMLELNGNEFVKRNTPKLTAATEQIKAAILNGNADGIKNFIGFFLQGLSEDKDLNRAYSDEARTFWQGLMRGRIAEVVRAMAPAINIEKWADVAAAKAKAPDIVLKEEEELDVVATSIITVLVQTATMLPFFAYLWDFAGTLRSEGQDREQMSHESIRYYIGQISYWSWIILHFSGSSDEDLLKFFEDSKTTDSGVFKAFKSFMGMDHVAIRQKFLGVFDTALDDVCVFIDKLASIETTN